jgi:transposase
MTKPKRRQYGRGKQYPPKVISKALSLITKNKHLKEEDRLSLNDIAKRVGVKSPQTILNWVNLKKRGVLLNKKSPYLPSNRLLTPAQEMIAAGYISLQSINFFSTATKIARVFIHDHFGVSPNKSWMSRWASRNHLSWRKVQRRTTNVRITEIRKQIMNFLNELKDLNLEPKKIICIDKTYLRTQDLRGRQLAPIGRYIFLRTRLVF